MYPFCFVEGDFKQEFKGFPGEYPHLIESKELSFGRKSVCLELWQFERPNHTKFILNLNFFLL